MFQAPGPKPAIDAFSGRTVLMMAWISEDTVRDMIGMAGPDTRFLFNFTGLPLDEAKAVHERLRPLCTTR